ncbi:hypothetical protein V8D89_008061 [Ganoderma adspersum]
MVAQTAGPAAAFESLSPNDAIQFILADIPVFCVGILALGTFTFFFLMKRVDRWIFCLHLSVFLSFLAAIFDLSQLLIQGRSSNEETVPSGVTGLITAREVFYSFANGFRLLFYWGFVAMIPLGETIPEGNKMHSGSWRRWGLVGLVLKWSTLLLVLLITLFQLIYRDVPALDQIGPVYEAAATLEIISSAVFILKLLLNTWARFSVGSTTPSKGKMLVQYAPIIVALMFSMWIALGNVILFQFTETALGHFMRAIELYVAVVYMLTISFHHLRHLSFFPVYRPATRSNSFKRHSIEKSGEMLTANIIPEQKEVDLAEVIQENYRTAQEVPQTIERNSARSAKVESANQHQSMAARLSTWLGVAQPQQVPVQSWDVDTERGASPVENAIITPWYAPEPQQSRTPSAELVAPPVSDDDERRGPSPTPDSPVETKAQERPPLSATPSAALPVEIADIETETTAVPDRDWQDLEYSNAVRDSGIGVDVLARALSQKHHKAQDDSPMSANIQVVAPPSDDEVSLRPDSIDATSQYYPASPLGSTTVTPLARSRPLPPMPVPSRPTSVLPSPISPMVPDSARSSNISVLVRRQNELDESIAALRLFSPSKQQFDVNQAPGNSATYDYRYSQDPSGVAAFGPSTETEGAAYAESWTSPDLPLTTPRTKPQSSARNEFFFDQQPPLNRMSADSAVIPVENQVKTSNQLVPPRMPVSRFSDSSSVGEREARIDSMGTQYDITSFVGNLTVPMNHASMMSSTSVAYSEEGSVNVATIANPPTFARPTLITQQATLPPPRVEQVPPMPTMAARRALPPIPQPASLLHVPQVQTPKPVATGDAPPRFRRAVGLPAHPRPQLSIRNLTPVEEKSSPSDTATLVTSPLSGSGTPLTGKA